MRLSGVAQLGSVSGDDPIDKHELTSKQLGMRLMIRVRHTDTLVQSPGGMRLFSKEPLFPVH
jgi:hypothetical protein